MQLHAPGTAPGPTADACAAPAAGAREPRSPERTRPSPRMRQARPPERLCREQKGVPPPAVGKSGFPAGRGSADQEPAHRAGSGPH